MQRRAMQEGAMQEREMQKREMQGRFSMKNMVRFFICYVEVLKILVFETKVEMHNQYDTVDTQYYSITQFLITWSRAQIPN